MATALHAHGSRMLVLTLAGSRTSTVIRAGNSVLARTGLPRNLPGHG